MKTILALALLPFFVGCFSMGRPIDQNKVTQIKKGESTRADVEALLGKPNTVGFTDGPAGRQVVLTYMYSLATTRAESFIPYAGAFMGGVNTKTQMAVITIGADDKVESVTTSFGEDQSGMNLSARVPGGGTNAPAKAVPGKKGGQ